MDCADIRDELVSGRVPSGALVDEHTRGCPSCAELLARDAVLGRALARGRPAEPELDPVLAAVRASVAAEVGVRARLRALRTPSRVALSTGVALALGAMTALFSRRSDWSGQSTLHLTAVLLVVALGCAVSVSGALSSLGSRHRPRARLIAGAAGLLVPACIALWPSSGAPLEAPHFLRGALGCFVFGVVSSLPLAWALGFLRREDQPSPSGVLLAAAAGGFAASMTLALHCALNDPAHLLLGHATPGIFWAAGMASAGRFVRARHVRARA